MIFLYITVGSITSATRLKKLIEKRAGYPAYLVHTPAAINETGGCSYSVRADNRLAPLVRPLSEEYGIGIKNIYTEEFAEGERVFNAVP